MFGLKKKVCIGAAFLAALVLAFGCFRLIPRLQNTQDPDPPGENHLEYSLRVDSGNTRCRA